MAKKPPPDEDKTKHEQPAEDEVVDGLDDPEADPDPDDEIDDDDFDFDDEDDESA